jgi:hypothetical protein
LERAWFRSTVTEPLVEQETALFGTTRIALTAAAFAFELGFAICMIGFCVPRGRDDVEDDDELEGSVEVAFVVVGDSGVGVGSGISSGGFIGGTAAGTPTQANPPANATPRATLPEESVVVKVVGPVTVANLLRDVSRKVSLQVDDPLVVEITILSVVAVGIAELASLINVVGRTMFTSEGFVRPNIVVEASEPPVKGITGAVRGSASAYLDASEATRHPRRACERVLLPMFWREKRVFFFG